MTCPTHRWTISMKLEYKLHGMVSKTFAQEMKEIDPYNLVGEGYTEARDWNNDFGKEYGWPFLVGIVGFIAGFVCLFTGTLSVNQAGLIAMISFIEIIVVWSFFRHSKPVSPITGKRLTQYLSTNPTPRDPYDPDKFPIVEMVYVDHDSKKFFKHIFVETDPHGGG
jgi:hypothetical protein